MLKKKKKNVLTELVQVSRIGFQVVMGSPQLFQLNQFFDFFRNFRNHVVAYVKSGQTKRIREFRDNRVQNNINSDCKVLPCEVLDIVRYSAQTISRDVQRGERREVVYARCDVPCPDTG